MSKSFERFQRRKLISSYFSVTLSIALVLFLLGILGLLVLNTKKLADHFKEQHSEEIGENFLEFLGYNPLKNSIDVNLNAAFVSTSQVDSIAADIGKRNFVEEVSYDRPTISLLTENVRRIGLGILIASAIFTLIAVLLINSSIRLSIYSKRFIIKTMQMVGATKSFIRRPFIWTNIKLGVLGALLAIVALFGLLYYLDLNFPQLGVLQDLKMLAILFSGVFILGLLISLVSTYFATQRFLNLRTDDLYY
jgi:cell division transport system permease protein